MRPVDQTKFVADPESDECGNCMQAAVASLLELPLDDVPHFAAEPDDQWWWTFVAFCRSHGYAVVQTEEAIEDVLGLMSGQSPRGDFQHLVVACGPDVVHDPHPSREGLDGGGTSWWYLVPKNPVP